MPIFFISFTISDYGVLNNIKIVLLFFKPFYPTISTTYIKETRMYFNLYPGKLSFSSANARSSNCFLITRFHAIINISSLASHIARITFLLLLSNLICTYNKQLYVANFIQIHANDLLY